MDPHFKIVDESLVEENNKSMRQPKVENVCDICVKIFECLKKFKLHQKVHHINPVSCDVCPKSFKLLKYTQEHTKNVHHSKTYSCDECNKEFATKGNVTLHKKSAREKISW